MSIESSILFLLAIRVVFDLSESPRLGDLHSILLQKTDCEQTQKHIQNAGGGRRQWQF